MWKARTPTRTMRKQGESAKNRSRRRFLKVTGRAAGAALLSPLNALAHVGAAIARNAPARSDFPSSHQPVGSADYTLHIKSSPIEIARGRILSATTYNGQF